MSRNLRIIIADIDIRLVLAVDRLATAKTSTRDEQLNALIGRALSLERLPEVEPSGDGDSYESAHAYRERLQLILDVA